MGLLTEIQLTESDWTQMKGNPELSTHTLILWLEVWERLLAQAMGKPALNLIHEVSYTTISNSNSVHPPTSNTSTHETLLFPCGTHAPTHEASLALCSSQAQRKCNKKARWSTGNSFYHTNNFYLRLISPSQLSPDGEWLDISQSAGKIWKLVWVGGFPPPPSI